MNQGFTLIELLVVVLIIGVLSAVALPQYNTAVERARATEALAQMSAIADSIERYHAQHEAWPTSFNKLDIDIPTFTKESGSTYHGGKYFQISISNDGQDAEYFIDANHAKTVANKPTYSLQTKITVDANGSYSRTRSCTPSPADNADAIAYCNAITGGNNDDF